MEKKWVKPQKMPYLVQKKHQNTCHQTTMMPLVRVLVRQDAQIVGLRAHQNRGDRGGARCRTRSPHYPAAAGLIGLCHTKSTLATSPVTYP